MEYINIGIGECGVSTSENVELRTYALGSCVAVVIFDPVRKIAGLAHIALPDSSADPVKAKTNPCYFANTGIPKLLAELNRAGATPIPSNLVVKITGGFNTLNNTIGMRNAEKIKEVLKSLDLYCTAADTGGTAPRTVFFKPSEQMLRVHSPDGRNWIV